MKQLLVIKIGGNIIDDDKKLHSFLQSFAKLAAPKILVHGGGKLATRMAGDLGIEQKMVEGRRITDEKTLRIVTMVYAGFINKNVVATLQSFGCNAIGITGADGDAITAHKRIKGNVDYGFAGDIDHVNTKFLHHLLAQDNDLVVAPITHDRKGQLLNTNADTVAQEIATAMSALYDVSLIYGFEKSGVLTDSEDDSTVIPLIDPALYKQLREESVIFAGMIPKLDNAFSAINKGVNKVIIGKAENLLGLVEGRTGTTIKN